MTLGRKKDLLALCDQSGGWVVPCLMPKTTGGSSLTFGAEFMISRPIFLLNKPSLSGKTNPDMVTERKQNIVGHFSACNGLLSSWPVSSYHCFLASGVLANENYFFFTLPHCIFYYPESSFSVLDTLLGWSCDSTLSRETEELSFFRCKDCVRPLAVCAGAEYTTK